MTTFLLAGISEFSLKVLIGSEVHLTYRPTSDSEYCGHGRLYVRGPPVTVTARRGGRRAQSGASAETHLPVQPVTQTVHRDYGVTARD